MHQARGPVPDKGAHTCPDPWPSMGIIIINPDTCIRSASQLKGEQNIHSPSVGSKLHAAPPAPQNFPSSLSPSPFPPFVTLVHKNPLRGEGVATKQHTIDDRPHPKPSKLPDTHGKGLQEAGGVPSVLGNSPVFPENPDPFGLPGADKKADVPGVEPLCIDVYKRGGALLLVGIAPALAKETASVGPVGKAEKAVATKPEALVPWAQYKARRGWQVNEPPHEVPLQKDERNAEVLSRKYKRCLNKGRHKLNCPPRELSHEVVLSTWEGQGPWDPGGGPAREQIAKSKGPFETKKNNVAGIDAPQQNTAMGSIAHQHEKPGCLENQSDGSTFHNKSPCTCSPSIILGSCHQEAYSFSFQGPLRGRSVILGNAEAMLCMDSAYCK